MRKLWVAAGIVSLGAMVNISAYAGTASNMGVALSGPGGQTIEVLFAAGFSNQSGQDLQQVKVSHISVGPNQTAPGTYWDFATVATGQKVVGPFNGVTIVGAGGVNYNSDNWSVQFQVDGKAYAGLAENCGLDILQVPAAWVIVSPKEGNQYNAVIRKNQFESCDFAVKPL